MPSTYSMPCSEPRRPTLMQSPSTSTLLGSPSTQWSNFSPRAAAHCSSFIVPLTEMSSSSPVIRNEIEPFGSAAMGGEIIQHRGDAAGDAALHVDGAAAVQKTVLDVAGERAVGPGALVAGRHHVGVSGKGEVRRRGADAGVEVVDIGGAGFAEGEAMHLEAGGLQNGFEHAERAGVGRGYRGAAQQVAGDGEGGEGIIHAPA